MDKVSKDSGGVADFQVVLRDVFALKASSTLHNCGAGAQVHKAMLGHGRGPLPSEGGGLV